MLMGRPLRLPVKSTTVQRKATRPGQGQRGGTRDWQPPLLQVTGIAQSQDEDLNRGIGGAAGRRMDPEPSAFPDCCRSMGLRIWSRYGDRDEHFAGEMPPLRRLAHGRFFEAEFTARNTVQMCAVPPSGGRSVATGKRRAPLRKSCILRAQPRDTMKIRSHSESHLVELDDGS